MLIHQMLNRCAKELRQPYFLLGMCLIGMMALKVTPASAAIVNNNHLFQMSSTLNQKVLALANAKKITITDIDAPIFSGKLPIHLYAKSLDIYDQTRRLSDDNSLPDKGLPNSILRPTNVLNLLSDINDVMDSALRNAQINPQGFEQERPLGKNANEAFRDLWLLSYRLAALVPPPNAIETLHQLNMIEAQVRLIATQTQLTIPSVSLGEASAKTPRDVMLTLYQDMHLLGRLQRQLGTEAIAPGALRSGELGMADIYDTARTLLADLHRMKTSLSIDNAAKNIPMPKTASLNDLYSRAQLVHDLLLSLTGSSL